MNDLYAGDTKENTNVFAFYASWSGVKLYYRKYTKILLKYLHAQTGKVGWLVVLMINVDLAIFQLYLDLEAGDNQSLSENLSGEAGKDIGKAFLFSHCTTSYALRKTIN